MLVPGVVVHHQVQIEVRVRALVDAAQEADELLMAVPLGNGGAKVGHGSGVMVALQAE